MATVSVNVHPDNVGDLMVQMSLIKIYNDDIAEFDALFERVGPEDIIKFDAAYRHRMTQAWSSFTDLPFPYECINIPRLFERAHDMRLFSSVLHEFKKEATSDRVKNGERLMAEFKMYKDKALMYQPQAEFGRLTKSEQALLQPRPLTKSTFCQEKVFKQLSRDERPIQKGGRANVVESKESFLLCTIVGFRGRRMQDLILEPVGSCGMYENEARYLSIHPQSIMHHGIKNYEISELMDNIIDVGRDIKVYEVERIPDNERSEEMSLLDKPIWSVSSFAMCAALKVPKELLVFPAVVFVEKLHPAQHAVTVSGEYFPTLQYVHMGEQEMPPLHSFLNGFIYQSKYYCEGLLLPDALIYNKVPSKSNEHCRQCGCLWPPYFYMSYPSPLTGEALQQRNAMCIDRFKVSLKEYCRLYCRPLNVRACAHCERAAPPVADVAKKSKTRTSGSDRKVKEKVERDSSQKVAKTRRDKFHEYNNSHSSELAGTSAVPGEVGESVINQPPPKVVKPDPIRCNLCPTDIQPMDEVYFKVDCLENCQLTVHKKCMQDSLAGQGLHKKRSYKIGICPTDGCSAHIEDIYEFSIMNTKSLYLKCASKSKKNTTDDFPRKNDVKTKVTDQTVEAHPVAVYNDVTDENKIVVDEVSGPSSAPPVVASYRPQRFPPPKPNRSIPLPVYMENVVPLVREKDPLEAKYAVSELPQKRTKPPNSKKVVLDIPIGFRREQNQESSDQPEHEEPVQSGSGLSQFQYETRQESAFWRSQHDCKICLQAMKEEQELMWCQSCADPYHMECIHTWLSSNSSCPQCRGNWNEPVDYSDLSYW